MNDIGHDEAMMDFFKKKPDVALELLNEVLKDGDREELMIVLRQIDLDNPPPLTDGQKQRLIAIAAMPDEQIDYSDAPYLPEVKWVKAVKVSK
ncbi:hypothetical protein [Stenoxybacter acetivorans]|uniref:hypothetical protein n=1 Tax=Stenoxybacter acetivorans TaxID=422441 RepID=UPI00068F9C69|nr:hypothetical protein [Stenoxybacter acetivorans]